MQEKLEALLFEVETVSCYGYRLAEEFSITAIADELLEGGAIVVPEGPVWHIVDRNTSFATAMPKPVDELRLYEIRDLSKYGYYLSKEDAELEIKSGGN